MKVDISVHRGGAVMAVAPGVNDHLKECLHSICYLSPCLHCVCSLLSVCHSLIND